MKDLQNHRDILLREAEECRLISHLAADAPKRELFAKLEQHHRTLAAEIQSAIGNQGLSNQVHHAVPVRASKRGPQRPGRAMGARSLRST